MKKKTYNPFKMWGSYAGAVLGWLTLIIGDIKYFNFWYLDVWQQTLNLPPISSSAIILTTSLGFLIGWGIHSLIRRFRK